MAKCDICGKRRQFGRNVSHSKRRTRREWKPNIQRVTLIINGRPTHLKLCTRCLRNQHKVTV